MSNLSESGPHIPVSVWRLKPWWCQPWSIGLTGMSLIGGSWILCHRVWVTGGVSVPVLIWMGYFLWVYPRLFRQYQEQAMVAAKTVGSTMSDRQP